MRTLRHFPILARLVLAWFVLSLGVAVASPIVKPKDLQMVCTAAGAMQMVAQGDDDGSGDAKKGSMLDCPLCANMAAAPPLTSTGAEPAQPLAHALQSIPAAHIAARTAAPLPPRGPPTV